MSEEQNKPDSDHPWGERNEHYHGEGALPPAKKVRRGRLLLGLLIMVCIVAVIIVYGILSRSHQKHKLKDETDANAAPTVLVVKPTQESMSQELTLPSNMQPYIDAPIYARTSGYLGHWYFDIGAHVRRGQLLAKIESPEVDRQLAQGQADLQTAMANAKLANITAERYSDLLKTDAVAKQDVDNAVQQAAAQNATVKSQQSNVGRLQQLVNFEQVVAPFSGIVTVRNTDVGQLINAGNGGTTQQQLFQLQDIHVLRVYVNVPQAYALDSRPGSPAYVTLDLYPNHKFWGKIVRNANAIDVPSRTLNVEVDVDNADEKLLAGAYAVVHIPLHEPHPTLTIPVSALIFRTGALQVATLENGDTLKLVTITPGRDSGTTIEVVNGLDANAQVVTNPPDSAVDGSKVRVVQPGQSASDSGPSKGKSTEESSGKKENKSSSDASKGVTNPNQNKGGQGGSGGGGQSTGNGVTEKPETESSGNPKGFGRTPSGKQQGGKQQQDTK